MQNVTVISSTTSTFDEQRIVFIVLRFSRYRILFLDETDHRLQTSLLVVKFQIGACVKGLVPNSSIPFPVSFYKSWSHLGAGKW